MSTATTDLKTKLAEVTAERDNLARFKDWCHSYLDGKGVPHHPPGTHGAEGCRIGDRMDWLFAELDKVRLAAPAPDVDAAWEQMVEAGKHYAGPLVDNKPMKAGLARLLRPAGRAVPGDDGETVTEEWLLDIGFGGVNAQHGVLDLPMDNLNGWYLFLRYDIQRGEFAVMQCPHGEVEATGLGLTKAPCETRGHVRRLCSALGLSLAPGGPV